MPCPPHSTHCTTKPDRCGCSSLPWPPLPDPVPSWPRCCSLSCRSWPRSCSRPQSSLQTAGGFGLFLRDELLRRPDGAAVEVERQRRLQVVREQLGDVADAVEVCALVTVTGVHAEPDERRAH